MSHFEFVVIGSGQAGTPLAATLANAGRKTALVERQHVGGTCLNEGCTPPKTLIASGRAAYLARRAADYGINTGPISIDMQRIRQRKRDIVASFVGSSERRLESSGVELIWGEAAFAAAGTQAGHALEVHLVAGGSRRITVDAETDQILGFAALGLEGGELMASVQIAMLGGLSYKILRDTIFAHPTLSEALNTLFATI